VIRVVFDTNILLSAILFGGNPEKLIRLAWERKIRLLVSPTILLELVMVLRDKFRRDDEEAKKAVQTIGSLADLVKPRHRISVLNDDPDNRVLECAVEGRADFIVSGDSHLLALKDYQGTPILKAAEFLNKFAGSKS
jgi:putative PIN family toxin of toxin-antitoxin system